MKHLFSFLAFATCAWGTFAQTDTYLYLNINADGASAEDIVVVELTTQPAMVDGAATLTLLGDDTQTFMAGLPLGTMQGTVTAFFVNCEGDSLIAQTFMAYNGADSSGMTLLYAELELPYCDSEDQEFEGWDEDLDLDALEAYLDSLCGQVLNPDAWMYCGLLESLADCEDGDTLACLDVVAWLDGVEWVWQDEEEEEEEEVDSSDCNAEFMVLQAFGNDSLPISNVLWVYVYDYDDSNDYLWSFGDEGTSSDPFPTWVYETDGPYDLCLTVTNEEDSCSNTYCQSISVDSLGWWTGFVDGFTISVFDADLGGSVSTTSDMSLHQGHMTVYPNPLHDQPLRVEWASAGSGLAVVDLMTMDGRVASTTTSAIGLGLQRLTINTTNLPAGVYLVRLSDARGQFTQRVVIR